MIVISHYKDLTFQCHCGVDTESVVHTNIQSSLLLAQILDSQCRIPCARGFVKTKCELILITQIVDPPELSAQSVKPGWRLLALDEVGITATEGHIGPQRVSISTIR